MPVEGKEAYCAHARKVNEEHRRVGSAVGVMLYDLAGFLQFYKRRHRPLSTENTARPLLIICTSIPQLTLAAANACPHWSCLSKYDAS